MTTGSDATPESAGRSWRDHYLDPGVAERYLVDRFTAPLGALLHARQASVVRRALAGRDRPRVVDVAAGPARFARDLADAGARSLFLDRSLPMLLAARGATASAGSSSALRVAADAFALPCADQAFDLVLAFRFLRHFDAAERERCYLELRRVLAPGGELLLDAVNRRVSAPLRAAAPGEYPLPDRLYTEASLHAELARAALPIVALVPVQRRYRVQRRLQVLLAPRSRRLASWAVGLAERTGGDPLEWVVRCRRA
jgi:ubiquinone/menaquinone biosynthesis C-methylase UbiE